MVDGHINRECVSHDYSSYDSPNAKSHDVLPYCHGPVSKSDRAAHWHSSQKMRELACNLVTSVLAVILCDVCLKIRQYVSKLDSLSASQTFYLTDCLDRTWESLHAILSWASWQWIGVKYDSTSDNMSQSWTACLKIRQSAHWHSWQKMRELACNLVAGVLAVILCEVCLKIRQYVFKLDSLSQSWTICSVVFLTKDERACMKPCYGRLGSDLVWSMSQDQTVCVEVGQPVSNLDILAHWLSWQNMSKLACNLVTGVLAVIVCEVCFKIREYVSKLDSLSQSWTICLLVFLTKDERACMQSCCRRLGSDLVWSMSQDQTVCLEVGQPVSKLDILAHWLSWDKTENNSTSSNKLTCTLVFSRS